MHCDHLHSMVPLERYRDIMAALASERDWWGDSYWLRFAAQAAVLCPDAPATIASRIRTLAESLAKHAAWYESLASPARFVVAAMLIQHHVPVHEFIAEHRRLGELFREVGLRHGGFAHTIAVLILHFAPERKPMSMLEAERLKAIYDQMKKFHWWLTGPEDLPACAALAQCEGTAEAVVARAEDAYQQLHRAGLVRGEHLQTAANLLPLAGVPIDVVVRRYLALRASLEASAGPLDPERYDALALLSLLDHRPDLVAQRVVAVRKELELFQPEHVGISTFALAADLAFLDLVRLGSDQEPHGDAQGMAGMLRTLHTYHVASAVLVSQLDIELDRPVGGVPPSGWPYAVL